MVILYTAAKRNPEFLGYKGKPFPGQLPPRPHEIQPRRVKYPKDFQNDWKKIGSKRTKFEDLREVFKKKKKRSEIPSFAHG